MEFKKMDSNDISWTQPAHSKSWAWSMRRYMYELYFVLHRYFNTSYFVETVCTLYYAFLSSISGTSMRLEWKTHWQSPVCRAILRRKYYMYRSKHSFSSTLCNLILASFILLEMQNHYVSHVFASYSYILWYFEFCVATILLLNAAMAFALYCWSLFAKPMPISPIQQRLFRISQNDSGFEIKKEIHDSSMKVSTPEHIQFTSWRNSSGSPSYLSITPINYSMNSWISQSPGSSEFETTSSSWNFYRASSPLNFSTPIMADKASYRHVNKSDHIESSYEWPITNKKHLDKFLKDCEQKSKSMPCDDSKSYISSMTTLDSSPISALSNCRYQRAYRLITTEADEEDPIEGHSGDALLNKLKITDKTLTAWCECIRKWICQTILVKLIREIDDINSTLAEIGLPEFRIGSVSSFTLQQLAITKAQHVPTLATILPYLDLRYDQEYLVRRIKDLAHGGCLGDYKWNTGGAHDDKPWIDDYPTDAALILHIICCYFDSQLPPEPHFPEGKPFSSKYLKKVPDKITLSKDSIYIYQSSFNPPHFKVVIGEDVFALPKKRNNLFYALVIFLHHFKVKEHGMLGRVNLGPSGLNILWVLQN